MDSVEFIIFENSHLNDDKAFVILTDSMYSNIIDNISFNYLLIIFLFG